MLSCETDLTPAGGPSSRTCTSIHFSFSLSLSSLPPFTPLLPPPTLSAQVAGLLEALVELPTASAAAAGSRGAGHLSPKWEH